MNALTPHAFDAILAQIACKADLSRQAYAMIDGVQWEFEARFRTEVTGPFGDDYGRDYWETACDLIGAWAFDPDTGQHGFAGNRAEIVALVGEETARRWEREAEEEANE